MSKHNAEDEQVKKAALSAAAELAGLYARLGMMVELEAVLNAVQYWPISGSETEKIRMAAEGLESMKTLPEHSFKCGPYALGSIRKALEMEPVMHNCIIEKASTENGISLAELVAMAAEMNMDWVAAKRGKDAELPLPALVHWKLGHYAAVLRRMDDGRLLVQDPTFAHDFLMTPEVFEQESSGHFLIPRSALGAGWQELSKKNAAAVFGKGAPSSKDSDDSSDKCSKSKNCGMAGYDFDFFKAGLLISDVPLAYQPHYGPAIEVHLSYRQRSEQVLDASTYGFGPKWTSNWSSYLQQSDSAGNFTVFLPGGQKESHTLNPSTGMYLRQKRNYRQLTRVGTNPVLYELQDTDGSKMVYSRAVSSGVYPKYLVTAIVDPQGNTVSLAYNSSNRLTGITDALGQTTNLYYENASHPHLVTKISDPFIDGSGNRRSALFEYDSSGRLIKITDAVGIVSSFGYDSTQTDFINQLTTPYGTTTFVTNAATETSIQFVEATDPLQRRERIEYRHTFLWLPSTDPAEELPDSTKIQSRNAQLFRGNTLYWDKKIYAHHPPNPSTGANYDKAERTKWMLRADYHVFTAVIENVKKANEARIWYEYAGQVQGVYGTHLGLSEKLIKIGRRISPTETAVDVFEKDDFGNTTKHTDTLGRVTKWIYAANGIDLLAVRQQNGTNDETLVTYTYNYADLPGIPRTVTDAAGQTTTLDWNAHGQITSIIQPGGLVTTLNYNATSGFLESVDGPLAGTSDITTFTPDLYGRVRTTTSPGSYTLTYDYDALDRPTLVTYPDGTTEQFSYQRANGQKILDLTHFKDRENRWTLFGYDALRQRTASIDPLGRNTRFHWCYCGALQDLWDAEGKKTHWDYDFTGRLIRKVYPDGKEINYTYQPLSGWLSTITDPLGQVKTHSYFPDGNLQGIAYTNTRQPTPNVSFTYDAVYGRLATMTDGNGTTSYTYHPVDGSTFGAGNLHTIDGPLADDTIAHTYDSLGRPKTLSINGAANTSTVDNYDALGRVTQFTNPLGVFTQTYDPVNLLPKTTTAPNGLTTELFYEPALGDLRLQEIRHKVGATNLAAHVYAYKPAGNIKSWTQTTGTSPAKTWAVSYDKADQLEAATQTQSGTVTAQQAFRFDKSGNITSGSVGVPPALSNTKSTFNNRNQLTTQQPGGWMRVRGTTDESSSVRVKSNNNPFTNAQTNIDNEFSGWVETVPGQNTLTIEATDDSPNANKKTNTYTINVTGQNRAQIYDFNGNMTNSGTGQTYLWDAANRLVKITYADGSSSSFQYDGYSRRTRITERNTTNTITSDKRYLWAGGNQPAEERDATTNAVTKRFFSAGEQRIGGADAGFYYYAKDHLGSIREITNASGAHVARYDFDLWGKRTKLTGTLDSDVGYTGHHHHAKSGLVLTWFRVYDAELQQWLSADPLGEAGGMNLYAYCYGNPLNLYDPDGLESKPFFSWGGQGGALLETGVTFLAGLGDNATFGITSAIRSTYAGNNDVDKCSESYSGGQIAGTGISLAIGGGGAQMLRGGRALNIAGGGSRQGIYVFRDATRAGKQYVGQSVNIGKRLGQHGSSRVGSRVKSYTVLGNRRALDSAEQQMIDKLGGVSNLANRRNQIGAARRASGYYNPRASADGVTGAGGTAGAIGAGLGEASSNCN